MTQQINTTVSDDFHATAKYFNISWSEALRIGLAVLFLERGVPDFKNPINIERIKSIALKLGLIVV